ncbi:MAG: hypothetical protein OMM_13247, partial [Candidatus Magnetoglobus multicellularis str. Araruama]
MENVLTNQQKISNAYNNIAEYYIATAEHRTLLSDYEFPEMVMLLGDVSGKIIIEPGCATGRYTQWFVERNAKVVSFDNNFKNGFTCKKRVGNKAVILLADLNSPLTFIKDNSIDIVFCSLVLHYI